MKSTLLGVVLMLVASGNAMAGSWTMTDLRIAGYWASGVSVPRAERRVAEPGVLYFSLQNFRYTDRYLCTVRFDPRSGVRSEEGCIRLRPGQTAESLLASNG